MEEKDRCNKGKPQDIEGVIEEWIRSGKWKTHEKIPPERQLALSLGVSRNTVRSALHILQGKGILGSRRGSGTFVQAVPEQASADTRHIFHARLAGMKAVFPSVAVLSAQSANAGDLLHLEEKLSRVGLAVHAGSAAEYARAQHAFLCCLAGGTHNTQVAAAAGHMLPQGRFFSEALGAAPKTAWESLFAELAGILGCLRRNQPEEAGVRATRYAELLLRVCRVPDKPEAERF